MTDNGGDDKQKRVTAKSRKFAVLNHWDLENLDYTGSKEPAVTAAAHRLWPETEGLTLFEVLATDDNEGTRYYQAREAWNVHPDWRAVPRGPTHGSQAQIRWERQQIEDGALTGLCDICGPAHQRNLEYKRTRMRAITLRNSMTRAGVDDVGLRDATKTVGHPTPSGVDPVDWLCADGQRQARKAVLSWLSTKHC